MLRCLGLLLFLCIQNIAGQSMTSAPAYLSADDNDLPLRIRADQLMLKLQYDEAANAYLDLLQQSDSLADYRLRIHAFNQLAIIEDYYDRQPEKSAYLVRANALVENFVSKTDTLRALTYRQLGEVLMGQGKLDSAQILLRESKTIYKACEHFNGWGWCQVLLGVCHYFGNDIKLMEKTLWVVMDSLAIERSGVDSDLLPYTANLISIAHLELGNYEKAIQTAKIILNKAQDNVSGVDSAFQATTHNNVGVIYLNKSDFHRASYHFEKAEYLLLNSSDPGRDEQLGFCYNHLALSQLSRGDTLKASNYFQKFLSLNLSKTVSTKKLYYDVYNNLSSLLRSQGKIDSAILLANNAMNFYERKQAYIALSNFGQAYIQKEDFTLGDQLLKESLESARSNLNENHPEVILRWKRLAESAIRQEQWDLAEEYLKDGLKSARFEIPKSDLNNQWVDNVPYPYILLDLMRLYAGVANHTQESRGSNMEGGLPYYDIAIALIEYLKREYINEEALLEFSKKAHKIYQQAVIQALDAYKVTGNSMYLKQAFKWVESDRAFLLWQSIKSSEALQKAPIAKNQLQRERELRLDQAFYRQQYWSAVEKKDTTKFELYRSKVFEISAAYGDFRKELANNNQAYADIKYNRPSVSVDLIQQALNDEEVLVEYFTTSNILYGFIIRNNTFEVIEVAKDTTFLNNLRLYTNAVSNSQYWLNYPLNSYNDFTNSSHYLYQKLLAPILEKRDVKEVNIVPDYFFGQLPFEALTRDHITNQSKIDFRNLPYVLKYWDVRYTFSAALYLEEIPALAEHFLAIAPDYRHVSSTFAPLPGADKEIKVLSDKVGGEVLVGTSAAKSRFKQSAPEYDILHLAMHGVVNPEQRALSFLQFTTESDDDGRLYSYELPYIGLNAKMVVLSACNTGQGLKAVGEGTMSMARDFFIAGAESVVMSIWKLEDRASSDIMIEFYTHLANGAKKSSALRMAKLDFLKNSDPFQSHPVFWSGLILNGSNSAILQPPLMAGIWELIVLILFILIVPLFFYSKVIIPNR